MDFSSSTVAYLNHQLTMNSGILGSIFGIFCVVCNQTTTQSESGLCLFFLFMECLLQVIHIKNLVKYSLQKSFQDLLNKQDGVRARWEYPFAAVGVNITLMLIQMLDLKAGLLIFSFVLALKQYHNFLPTINSIITHQLSTAQQQIF